MWPVDPHVNLPVYPVESFWRGKGGTGNLDRRSRLFNFGHGTSFPTSTQTLRWSSPLLPQQSKAKAIKATPSYPQQHSLDLRRCRSQPAPITASDLYVCELQSTIMSRRAAPNPAAERAAKNQATIKSLLKLEPNKVCADCKRNKRKLSPMSFTDRLTDRSTD